MDMIGKIRRMSLRDGVSRSAIAKATGLSRNTVKKWLRQAQVEAPRYVRQRRPGKLTAFEPVLPLALAEQRDVKGLYKKARRGELKNFTGIDSKYEVPEQPELRLATDRLGPDEAADQVIALLREKGCLA